MKNIRELIGDEYDLRMDAARQVSQWELGDPSWAGVIIGAFLHPNDALENLELEKGDP